MRIFFYPLLPILFLLFSGCSGIADPKQGESLALVPYPRKVEKTRGYFNPETGGLTGRISGIARRAEPVIFEQLAELSLDLYYDPGAKQPDPDFWIGIPGTDPSFDIYCQKSAFEIPDTLDEEGYVLEISRKGSILAARTTTGISNGLHTLQQLFRQFPDKPGLPCMKVTDWPAIEE